MKYSRIAENMPASPIRKMMVEAAKYSDSISFAVGEPDFKPCEEVFDAARASLAAHESAYSPGAGYDDLRKTYAEYLYKTVGLDYDYESVIVTVGGMSALFVGMMALLNEDDEVLVSAPYFSNYKQMIDMCHAKVVPVDVYEENNFVLTPEAVQACITDKTKLLLINSPCNPTGGIISEEALEKIAEIAIQNDLFVISDEVYRHIIFDGLKYSSIASLPGMRERTLIVDSCSKTFAMPGFRVGFATGPRKWIRLMIKLVEGIYSAVPDATQRAAVSAFKYGMNYCEEMRIEYQRRRDYIYDKLKDVKGLSCIKPSGAFYFYVNISGTGLYAEEFSTRLFNEKHVAVVPGTNFGASLGSSYIRISYATSMDNIKEGISRIIDFCSDL